MGILKVDSTRFMNLKHFQQIILLTPESSPSCEYMFKTTTKNKSVNARVWLCKLETVRAAWPQNHNEHCSSYSSTVGGSMMMILFKILTDRESSRNPSPCLQQKTNCDQAEVAIIQTVLIQFWLSILLTFKITLHLKLWRCKFVKWFKSREF